MIANMMVKEDNCVSFPESPDTSRNQISPNGVKAISPIKPIVEKEDPLKEPYENISSAQKIKDEKRILDFFSDLFGSDGVTEEKPEKQNIKSLKK